MARVAVLTSVAAVAAGAGFALAGDDSQSAAAHGRSNTPFGFSKVVCLSHVNALGMPILPGRPLLLQGHRIHIENMAGLEQMPANGGWIVVGGVRNEGGSGSPATVFGLVP